MSDRLTWMLQTQELLQRGYDHGSPWVMTEPEQRIRYMRDQFEAMVVEMVEAKNETGWKPWGTSRHINALACLDELIDHWHFYMNWLLCLGPLLEGVETVEDLAVLFSERFFLKNQVNIGRQTSGTYDGFAEKCPKCGREKTMAPMEEREAVDTQMTYFVRVCPCGEEWND